MYKFVNFKNVMEEVEEEKAKRYSKCQGWPALLMIALGPEAASTLLKRLTQKIRVYL